MARLICILLIVLLAQPTVCYAQESLKGLIDDYAHYAKAIRPTLTPEQTSAYDESWAKAIAGSIDQNDVPSDYLITANSLAGRLLLGAGAPIEAVPYLKAVVGETSADSATRLSAALDICSALAMSGSEADFVLDSISDYVQMMIEFDEMDVEYPDAHRLNGLRADAMRANLLTHAMQGWLAHDAFAALPEGTLEQLRAVHLDAAAMFQQRFVEFLLTEGDQHALLASDMSQLLAHAVAVARLNDMAATAYGTATADRAIAARNRTVALLNHLRTQTSEPFSHEAAVHLLHNYYHLLPANSMASYLTLAEEVVDDLDAGHGVINFLREQALELTNQPTRRGTARGLFDLIIATEVQWFPSEYESHVNYQWARLGAARNAIHMNNRLEAENHLQSLQAVVLLGNFFPVEYAKLAEATGFGSQN